MLCYAVSDNSSGLVCQRTTKLSRSGLILLKNQLCGSSHCRMPASLQSQQHNSSNIANGGETLSKSLHEKNIFVLDLKQSSNTGSSESDHLTTRGQ